MMWWNGDLSWWGWLGMTAMMVIFWGFVIWGIVALIRSYNPPGTPQVSPDERSPAPDSILAERFAKGEIDEQEYMHKREILESAGVGGSSPGSSETSQEPKVETSIR